VMLITANSLYIETGTQEPCLAHQLVKQIKPHTGKSDNELYFAIAAVSSCVV